MIVCKNCGHQNNDNDTFCGSCGKFLEWTGERVAVAEPEPEPAPPPPAPEPEPVRHSFIDRVKEAVGIDDAAAQPAGQQRPAEPVQPAAASAPPVAASIAPPASPASPAPLAPPAPSATSAPSAPPTTPQTTWRPLSSAPTAPPSAPPPGASVPAGVAEREPALAGVGASAPSADEPMSRRPTSVAPTVTRPRPTPRTLEPPTRRRPGDLICGQCGEGNDPSRHFCRRCGNTLAEAISVQLPWYRRLWNRIAGPKTYAAGYRHGRIGPPNVMGAVFRIIRLAIIALVVVFLLAFALVPSFHNLVVTRVTTAVTTIRKLVHPNFDPIHPTGASASSAINGHKPGLADDGFNNTYWAALPNDRAPYLKLNFAGPSDLSEIGITSGASGTAPNDQYLAQPRPHALHLVFSDGSTQDVTLADNAKAQFFPITAKQVTFVEIHIMSVYQTAGPAPSSVAITEVEFRVRD